MYEPKVSRRRSFWSRVRPFTSPETIRVPETGVPKKDEPHHVEKFPTRLPLWMEVFSLSGMSVPGVDQ